MILDSSSSFKLSKCDGIIIIKTDTPLSSKPSSLSSVPSSTLSGERTRPSSPGNTVYTPQREREFEKRMDPSSPTSASKKYFLEDVIQKLKNMAEKYSCFTVNLDGKYIKFDPKSVNMSSFLNYLNLYGKHYTMTIKNDHITLTSSRLTSPRVITVTKYREIVYC